MVTGPDFVLLHVPDIAAAKQFYTETLGYGVEAESPEFVQFANTGGATLALGVEGAGDPVELWWFVSDADATYADLQARGVEIVHPPADQPFGRTFSVKDVSGNMVNLLQLPTAA
jgi:predicted enzyme related to lactoylglutathione lyase